MNLPPIPPLKELPDCTVSYQPGQEKLFHNQELIVHILLVQGMNMTNL
jgi:hypothetical protein